MMFLEDGVPERVNENENASSMTFVVKEQCIKCKYTDCVEVCPVDCFYEGENMLVINPDECIDCGACEVECEVEAIKSDDHPDAARFLKINEEYSRLWPKITRRKDSPVDADQWRETKNKFNQYFSPMPIGK